MRGVGVGVSNSLAGVHVGRMFSLSEIPKGFAWLNGELGSPAAAIPVGIETRRRNHTGIRFISEHLLISRPISCCSSYLM